MTLKNLQINSNAMKKLILLVTIICLNHFSFGQNEQAITSIDFVEILNDNEQEAIYYYQNNWKVLREVAIKKNYIASFEILKDIEEGQTFDLILITRYKNKKQFDEREAHFDEIIKQKGGLDLMNEIQPKFFRKTVFSKDFMNP